MTTAATAVAIRDVSFIIVLLDEHVRPLRQQLEARLVPDRRAWLSRHKKHASVLPLAGLGESRRRDRVLARLSHTPQLQIRPSSRSREPGV
jgi:hypothetical protein